MPTFINDPYEPEEMTGEVIFKDFRTGKVQKFKGNLKRFEIMKETEIPDLEFEQLDRLGKPAQITGYHIEMDFHPKKFKQDANAIKKKSKK